MAGLPAVALPAAVLVDEELLALAAGDEDLAGDLDTRQGGRADLDVGAVGDQEDLIERHRALILGAFELLDLDRFAGLNPVLLTTCRDHGVHDGVPRSNRGAKSTKFRRLVNKNGSGALVAPILGYGPE